MKLQVIQIDAWIEPDGTWRYNNSIPICTVTVNGEPTTRKILKALYKNNLLFERRKFKVDDYFCFEGTYCVQKRSNCMPVFDLIEIE